jgi:hypothetical protein
LGASLSGLLPFGIGNGTKIQKVLKTTASILPKIIADVETGKLILDNNTWEALGNIKEGI